MVTCACTVALNTHHIKNTNELKVIRDRDWSRAGYPGVSVFPVSLEEFLVETRLIYFQCAFCENKDGNYTKLQ